MTARGNHQQPLFSDLADYQALERIVAMALEPTRARIHAYCWMTNHLHLLVEISDLPLGALMQRIGTRFARAVQRRVPTTGHLFENRYHALLVDVDEYFLVLLRYIHLNPVRAGVVTRPDQYRWSSHDVYCGRRQASWVTTAFGLALFAPETAEAQTRYERYLQDPARCDEPPANHEEPRVLGSKPTKTVAPRRAPPAPAATLVSLAGDICQQHGVALVDLVSKRRCSDLNRAREDLAARALSHGVATQREIAEFLHRSLAAVSRAATRGQSLERPLRRLAPNAAASTQLRKT